ncbi:hypothetical protein D3C83_175940 [compost metagenome]
MPPEDVRVSKEFWLQYDRAEEITKVLEDDPEFKKLSRWDIDEHDITKPLHKALSQCGIDPDVLLRLEKAA